MAHKGETYQQTPTLWHMGTGYPCTVFRRRRIWVTRRDGSQRRQWSWANSYHVLTMASGRRWMRLQTEGRAYVRKDVKRIAVIQMGIAPVPVRAEWAR